MCIPCIKTFPTIPKYLTLWPWPWPLTYFCKNLKLPITHEPVIVQLSYFTHMILSMSPFNWYHHLPPNDLDLDIWPTYQKWGKNLNLGYNFCIVWPRTFTLDMCLPCGKTFPTIPKYLTLWPWPWPLTYFCKNLKLPITHEPVIVQLSYFTHMILSMSPFNWYHHLPPNDLDLDIWPTYQKWEKTLTLAITFALFDPEPSNLTCVFLVARPFQPYQNIWPCDLDLDPWPTFVKILNCL